MTLIIDDNVWRRFPNMLLIVAYADGLQNDVANPVLDADLVDIEESLPKAWTYATAQAHPLIAAWRVAFRDILGLKPSDYPASIEGLVRRVVAGKGLVRVNPIVDFYNLFSLRHIVPVGGWDTNHLVGGDILLRETGPTDSFQELGATSPVSVEPGEVCYSDAKALITRHFVWRQSEEAKVTTETKSAFFVSELIPPADEMLARHVATSFSEGLQAYFGVQCHVATLRKGDAKWDWLRV